MKKLIRIALPILIILAMLMPSTLPALAAPSQKDGYTTGTWQTIMTSYGTDYFVFQTFTASSSYVLSSIRPYVYRTGAPGDVSISLYRLDSQPYGDGKGRYTGTALSTGSASGNALGTTEGTGSYLDVTMTAFYITEGDQYGFTVKALSGDSGNALHMLSNDDIYIGGYGWKTTGGGSLWFHTDGSRDNLFQVWGEVLAEYPTVSSITPTSITNSSATFQGNLTDLGNGAVNADVSFEWDYYDHPDDAEYSTTPVNKTEVTTFNSVTSLPVGGRPYYVRAIATNDLGKTAYGQTIYFNAGAFPVSVIESTIVHLHGQITHSFQRKAVSASGRHWLFAYIDPQDDSLDRGFYWTSSLDGESWDSWRLFRTPDARETGNEADEFSIFFDGTYIHITYILNRWYETPNTNDLWYRRGIPESNGTITWSADWQIAVAQDAGVKGYPTIAVDDDGHAYISYWDTPSHNDEMESGTKEAKVVRNDNTDGTWSTTATYPVTMANSDTMMFTCILKLEDNNMYVITTNPGVGSGATKMLGYLYNGSSWSGYTIIDAAYGAGGDPIVGGGRAWTASSWGSNIVLAYQADEHADGDLVFMEYQSGNWADKTTVFSGLDDDGEPSLVINGANQDIYLFWTEFNPGDYLHYIRYLRRINGIWDTVPTNWIDESLYMLVTDRSGGGDGMSSHLATYPEVYSGQIMVYYQTGGGDGSYTGPMEQSYTDIRAALLIVEAGAAVRTDDAAETGTTFTTLQGTLINDGGEISSVRFQWGLTTSYGNDTVWQGGKETGDVFSQALTGLSPDTPYFYRAQAKWADGTTSSGDGKVVTTNAVGPPTVSTGEATNISTTSSTLQGTLTSLGGFSPVYASFQYGLDTGYGSTTADQTRTSSGGFNADIADLLPDTLYHFRARIRYNSDYVYGFDNTFTTTSYGDPEITTGSAVSKTTTGATLQGTLTSLGDYSPVYVYFQYGKTIGYGATTVEQTKTSTGGFNQVLGGLDSDTLYHFRAVARYDGFSYIYGDDQTFTTTTEEIPIEEPPLVPPPVGVLYEGYNTGDDADSGAIYDDNWAFQTFTTPASAQSVNLIRLLLLRSGSPQTVTVSLRETSGGKPIGADLASATLNGNLFSTSKTWESFTLPSETGLEAETKYAIVVRAVGGNATNYIKWRWKGAGTYPGGTAGTSNNGGTSWTTGSADHMFEIWGYAFIEVVGVNVFNSYLEEGDWLFVALVRNEYPPYYPNEDPARYFDVRLTSPDGGTLLAQGVLRAWGTKPTSIYLSADEAAPLTLGTAYRFYIFGAMVRDYPNNYYTLTAADWRGDDLTNLDNYVITMAHTVADYYDTPLTAFTAVSEVLNDEGSIIFNIGIPALQTVRPDLFLPTALIPEYQATEWTDAFDNATAWEAQLGPQVVTILTFGGDMFGLTGKDFAAFLILLAYVLLAGSAAYFKADSSVIIGLALPLIVLGAWLRVIDIVILAAVGAVALFLFVYSFFWSRT